MMMMRLIGLRKATSLLSSLPLTGCPKVFGSVTTTTARTLVTISKSRDRGNDRERARVDALIEKVDPQVTNIHSPGKLKKSLPKAEDVKPVLSTAELGSLSALGSELEDVVYDALVTMGHDDEMIDVVSVDVSPCYSRVTIDVYSPIIESFADFAEQRVRGDEVKTLTERMTKNWLKSLQKHEPHLRSYVCRRVAFRRVPRFYFRLYDNPDKDEEVQEDFMMGNKQEQRNTGRSTKHVVGELLRRKQQILDSDSA